MPDGRRVRRAGSPRLCKSVKKRRSPENPKGTNTTTGCRTTTWRRAPRQLMNGAEADPKESRMKEVCRLGHKYRYQRDSGKLVSRLMPVIHVRLMWFEENTKFLWRSRRKPRQTKNCVTHHPSRPKAWASIKSVITFACQNRASHQGRKKSHKKAAKKLMQISRTNHYSLEHALVRA